MSRCLPYTRSIYKREDVSLIGSIKKLQIQWRNTKQRDQVSRKVNEKQNKKRSREEHDKLDSLHHKSKKRKADKNSKFIESFPYARKGDSDHSDHLERSDLSEEHGPPALVLSQCNSSKCTQNSNKKNAVQNSDPIKKKPGMVIRIKLPLKKHQDVEPASTSTNPYRSSQFTQSSKAQPFLTDTTPCCSSQVSNPSKSVFPESSPTIRETPLAKQSTSADEPCFSGPILSESRINSRSGESCTQRLERQLFKDLILNWKPPTTIHRIAEDEDELDWLFAAKKSNDAKPSTRICKPDISDPSSCPDSASSSQPRATYLPEFDMYRLPYVIPF